jgi:hypothetical protein
MKKILLFLCLLSVSYISVAQNTNVTSRLPMNHNEEGGSGGDNNSGFGIKGGVNFNHLRGADKSNFNDLKSLTAFHAGIYGQFPVAKSDFFSIQAEALFTREGYKSDSLDVKMDFIQVPFLFVFNVLDNVSVHVGPYGSVLLTLQENGKEVGESEKDMLNSFAYGIAGGVEARMSIARFGARYNLGLNDIYKDPKTVAGNKVVSDIKAGNFQIYVGVGFH